MNINNLQIFRANSSQLDQLQQISKKTFLEAFSEGNTEENMSRYLSEQFSGEKLLTELNNPGSEFYMASYNEEVIGYLKINSGKAQTVELKGRPIEIERIYVKKEYYGKKLGQLFCDLSKEIAGQKKADYIWLGVWEKNPRAIGFYKKNGFREFSKHLFKLGDDEQTDILMKLDMVDSMI